MGRQYGETMREELVKWNQIQHEQLINRFHLTEESLKEKIRSFFPACTQFFPGLSEQLFGMAEGSGITAEDAMLFQIYGELTNQLEDNLPECTSFVITNEYTKDGKHYSGQNADMWPAYAEKCSVVTFAVTGKPRITYLLPIGYLSYHGMNSAGISCNHNALFGSPWRKGLPRFFISRSAMEYCTINEIRNYIAGIDYVASRHILFADSKGNTLSCEFDSKAKEFVDQRGGVFVHTNHCLCKKTAAFEKISANTLKNSEIRLCQMYKLFEAEKGGITSERIQVFLKNHENGDDSICVHNCDGTSTFASLINCLDEGKMLIARGNPCASEYYTYYV